MFEATCRAWEKFKSSDGTFDECFRTEEFIVEVHETPKIYKVNLEKLLGRLDNRGRGPTDGLQRKWLRKLLDSNLPD